IVTSGCDSIPRGYPGGVRNGYGAGAAAGGRAFRLERSEWWPNPAESSGDSLHRRPEEDPGPGAGSRELACQEVIGHDALGVEPVVGQAEQRAAAPRAVPDRARAERQAFAKEATAHHPVEP